MINMPLRLRDMREDRDLPQKAIAAYLSCDQSLYSKYERGEREVPLAVVCKLADYYNTSVELGTIAAYEISPVMMDLYGLDMPLWFEKLASELPVLRARTRGVTVEPDSSLSESMTPQQEALFQENWLIQYDLMFGKGYWPTQGEMP